MTCKQTYLIKFYYGTDLQYELQITSINEVTALAVALDRLKEIHRGCGLSGYSWIDSPGFRLEISLND